MIDWIKNIFSSRLTQLILIIAIVPIFILSIFNSIGLRTNYSLFQTIDEQQNKQLQSSLDVTDQLAEINRYMLNVVVGFKEYEEIHQKSLYYHASDDIKNSILILQEIEGKVTLLTEKISNFFQQEKLFSNLYKNGNQIDKYRINYLLHASITLKKLFEIYQDSTERTNQLLMKQEYGNAINHYIYEEIPLLNTMNKTISKMSIILVDLDKSFNQNLINEYQRNSNILNEQLKNSFFNYIFISIAFILILAILSAYYSYNKIAKPFKHIISLMKELSEGNTHIDVPRDQKGELEDLANSVEKFKETLETKEYYQIQLLNMQEVMNRAKKDEIKTISEDAIEAIHSKNYLLEKICSESKNMLDLIITKVIEKDPDFKEKTDSYIHKLDETLEIAQVESGKVKINFKEINLKQFLDDIREEFFKQAHEKKLFFDLIIDRNVPEIIITDKKLLHHILETFIKNALKNTHEGEIIIRARLSEGDLHLKKVDPYKSISISVIDTGKGIDKNMKIQLMNILEEIEEIHQEKYTEAGLGMTIVGELSRLLEGEIHFESTLNKGSSFTLNLPFKPNQLIKDHENDITKTLQY